MSKEGAFHQAMLDNPNDPNLRMVFADWLEERGDPRGELLRLTHTLTQSIDVPQRAELESRMQALVDEGVQAVGPFWTNSIGMRFAWIPAGTFLMGATEVNQDRLLKQFGDSDLIKQAFQHRVTLTKGFFLGVHPVTQSQWQAVMGQNPSYFRGTNLPVECVSWLDSVAFCIELSKNEGKTSYHGKNGDEVCILGGEGYRLPTEAQWEYACRGGSSTAYCFGNKTGKLGEYAWYLVNASTTTHPVGEKKPNAWGLYDIHGNVGEWCEDWFDGQDYKKSLLQDPVNTTEDSERVLRGAGWRYQTGDCRAAFRDGSVPGDCFDDIGFRVLSISASANTA